MTEKEQPLHEEEFGLVSLFPEDHPFVGVTFLDRAGDIIFNAIQQKVGAQPGLTATTSPRVEGLQPRSIS